MEYAVRMPEDSPIQPRPAEPQERTYPKTEPDAAVLAEYMRLVEEARSRM